jgi:phosphonate transport system substrate-binding protein
MALHQSFLAIGSAAVVLAATTSIALAQDWKGKYPELTFAIIPSENASGVSDRWAPFMECLTQQIGVPVKLRVANDYAAVIEGQRAGNIQIAYYGPAAYARAYLTGVQTEPFAIEVSEGNVKGYYSVFYVKKDSPYQKIEDLKGKNLGLVDPNSTSGNNVPRFALDSMKIDPDTFFGKVVYTGSHENAVLALGQGTVDVAANWWNNPTDSNLTRMATKGMAKSDDFRVIYKSDMIVNSPIAYLKDMPADLKAKVRAAILDAPKVCKAAYDKLSDGKNLPFEPTDHKAYEPVVELIRFVDTLRKKKSS